MMRTGRALGARDHRRIDADHLAARGHQGTAGIAGVERGVGLQHVVDIRCAQRPPERGDDAGGAVHRMMAPNGSSRPEASITSGALGAQR
jgi:hypothetical protein